MNQDQLITQCQEIRSDIVTKLSRAGSGHPGGSLSATELIAALYFGGVMKHDPKDPEWEGRDRFILSKGHAGPVVYSALARAGYFPDRKSTRLNSSH